MTKPSKRIKSEKRLPLNVQVQIMNERFGKVQTVFRDRRERRLNDARRQRAIFGED